MRLSLKQKPKFILSQRIKLFQYLLRLPILELEKYLDEQLDKNPLLEKIDISFFDKGKKIFDPSIIQIKTKPSLYEHLMFQAREAFYKKEDLDIAEHIIINLNKRGFLKIRIEDISSFLSLSEEKVKRVLKIVQRFNPIGIASKDLKDSLLIQLEEQKKEETIFFYIIKEHFEEFIYRKNFILKKFKIKEEELKKYYKDLKIDLTADFFDNVTPHVIVDIIIKYEDKKWKVLINEGFFIKNKDFIEMRKEEDPLIKKYKKKGLAIIKAIADRKELLKKIALFLIEKQKNYFLGEKNIIPYSISYLSEELRVHYSTAYRAISDKYIESPMGILPLKVFFSSNNKDILKRLIEREGNNLSDKKLAEKLLKQGIKISRRTVTKYRKQLMIPSSRIRKTLTPRENKISLG